MSLYTAVYNRIRLSTPTMTERPTLNIKKGVGGTLLVLLLVTRATGTDTHAKPATLDPMRTISEEKRLIKQLVDNYARVGKSGRPVLNTSTTVNVFFSLGLIQMDLDEREKLLSMSMWTRYVWTDEYMQWDPVDFGGIQSIRIEPHHIWIPDITLYNTATVSPDTRDALAVVSHDGLVTWFPHTIFKSSCSVDVTNFPFDIQQCHMWFGSWTYTSGQVNLSMSLKTGIDLSTFQSDYRESAAWEIISVVARRKVMPSEKATPNFVVLTYDLNIKRKLVFSSYILTLPCVFLALLTLVVFWLPPERPDRTSLAMSTFSSFMLLLLILVEAAPPTASSVPLLGVYYCFNMVIITLSIALSTLVVNLNAGFSCRVPKWISWLSRTSLLKCLCQCCKAENNFRRSWRRRTSETLNMCAFSSGLCDGGGQSSDNIGDIIASNRMHAQGGEVNLAHANNAGMETEEAGSRNYATAKLMEHGGVARRHNNIRMDATELEVMKEKRQRLYEWQRVAVMLDRLFFFIYLFLILISLGLLFPKPH